MEEYSTTSRACSKCGIIYPRTPEFFYKEKSHKDGMQNQCKTCQNKKGAQWSQANPAKSRAIKRAYYDRNRDLVIERAIIWHQEHPEEGRLASRNFYWRHIEDEKERKKLYRLTNPNIARVHKARRRARLRLAEGAFNKADIERQYKVQNGRCWWNPKEHSLANGYHADHLVPLARGGHNWPTNIVLACPFCNQSKSDKMPHEWAGRLL